MSIITPYDFACSELERGVAEWPDEDPLNGGENPRILWYFDVCGVPHIAADQGDETHWCAVFMGTCLKVGGAVNVPRSALARSYEDYGRTVDTFYPGTPILFWRGSKRSSGWGHIAFVGPSGHSEGYVECIGGNQGDAVSAKVYSTEKLIRCFEPEMV
jgi:uncharacterized protein (TIGR02594 family)